MENEYFVWEPEREVKKKNNSDGYNNGIKVVYFDLDLNDINLNNERHTGRNIKGLAGILIKEDIQDDSSPSKLYNIKFQGKIKKAVYPHEKDLMDKEYHRETCRNLMKKMRQEKYNQQMVKYFPKQELENKISGLLQDNKINVSVKALRNLIGTILNEKKPLEEKEMRYITYSHILGKEIEKFMNEHNYAKDGDKYVKIQEEK